MKKLIGNRGITLIALVITIIVLLILAGVSIAMLTGQNGILTQANTAKIETRGAAVEEARDLWRSNKEADNYVTNGTAESLEELINNLVTKGQLTEDEKDQILGNTEKGIEATGKVTIGSRTIDFGIEEKEPTVEDIYYFETGAPASDYDVVNYYCIRNELYDKNKKLVKSNDTDLSLQIRQKFADAIKNGTAKEYTVENSGILTAKVTKPSYYLATFIIKNKEQNQELWTLAYNYEIAFSPNINNGKTEYQDNGVPEEGPWGGDFEYILGSVNQSQINAGNSTITAYVRPKNAPDIDVTKFEQNTHLKLYVIDQ